jgi:hypothetical protein
MPTVTIPLPPIALKVNRTMGQHWASHHNVMATYRLTVKLEVLRQWSEWRGYVPPNGWPVHVTIVAYLGKGQRADTWDVPGWVKAGLDVLVSQGAWPDDGSKYLRPVTVDVGRDWKRPRVEITW